MSESRVQLTCGLVRAVSRSMGNCELLHAPRQQVDLDLARQQHRSYVDALKQEGVSVTILPEAPDYPDATFVEDTVVMLDEAALVCRPGAASRRQEPALM